MSQYRWVYVTVGSLDEAQDIAFAVVEERLAAGANILPGVVSIYRWKGEVRRGHEAVLVVKTTAARLAALVQRVTEIHGYECPCIVGLPIDGGNPDYLAWIGAETAAGS